VKRSDALNSLGLLAWGALTATLPLLPIPALARGRTPDDPGQGVVHAGEDIVLESTDIRQALEASADGNFVYVVKFTFTNNLGTPFVPMPSKFVFEDDSKTRHTGLDSGSPELVGISNTYPVLKVGDSHEYTLGFRVFLNTAGTLFYDPT
jgi:hypothetical protein